MPYRLQARAAALSALSFVCLLTTSLAAPAPLAAQPSPAQPAEPDQPLAEPIEQNVAPADASANHFRVRSSFALRAVPIGTQLSLDGGYRIGLSDSESVLLKDTYLEAGVATNTTPSNFWGGAYVEALPLAVLKLRLSAQSLHYFGTFGYLNFPADAAKPDWSLDEIGGSPGEGNSASGYLLDAHATLQAKVGNVVVQVPMRYSYIDMDVEQVYYESSFDFLLAPTDQMWTVTPTLGYVFALDEGYVLAGLRWEHAETVETGLSRDMPTAMGLWKLPGNLAGGDMQLVGLGGYWLDHPNRQGTPYFATQFAVDWKY